MARVDLVRHISFGTAQVGALWIRQRECHGGPAAVSIRLGQHVRDIGEKQDFVLERAI
jgi:hypothetical protein